MLSHETLKIVADSVNPTLGVLALALPWTNWHGRWRPPTMHIGITLLTVALTYFFRGVLGLEAVWALWGLDFSAHGAICIVLGVALASLDWRKTWIWVTVFLGYAILMVYQSYHTWADLGTTGVVMLPFAVVIRYWGDRWSARTLRSNAAPSL